MEHAIDKVFDEMRSRGNKVILEIVAFETLETFSDMRSFINQYLADKMFEYLSTGRKENAIHAEIEKLRKELNYTDTEKTSKNWQIIIDEIYKTGRC